MNLLKMSIWNANGLCNHGLELISFLQTRQIDIMLISETHYTSKSHIKIPNYTVYNTRHPDGTGHGGTAIIIKNSIKHYELDKYDREYLQATTIMIEDWIGPLIISAIYSPPKHNIKADQYVQYFNSLGHRFIAGGDFNAKHTQWGSKTITTKGRQLLNAMQTCNLNHISTGEPTYWPTDRRKNPDLLDFCITKGIPNNYLSAKSCLDLSSDHSPVIVQISTRILNKTKSQNLYNKKTDWNQYRSILNERINLNVPLKTEENLEHAIKTLNENIQEAAKFATPNMKSINSDVIYPIEIKNMIVNKRKLRKRWQITRCPMDKQILNRATKEIKNALYDMKNACIQNYLKNLTATEITEYSLWKATRSLKRPAQHIPPIKKPDDSWARSDTEKTLVFAEHIKEVFKAHNHSPSGSDTEILKYLHAPYQLSPQIKYFKINEVKQIIKLDLSTKKAPGYDKITGKLLQEATEDCIQLITYILNGILRLGYFPDQLKVAEIILIQKPGKDIYKPGSYRPISLIPTISKVFEKLFLLRLRPIIEIHNLIPQHQFGFRERHSTIEQVHRIVKKISNDLEEKRFCSAAFLDISQAFDRVWQPGLLFKLKKNLPHHFYIILKSYITKRYFKVRINDERSALCPIAAGVPQGSVLGPLLYVLFTADLPCTEGCMVATYADDTALLASHEDPDIASKLLQNGLDAIQTWMRKWKIQANDQKSVHVTFALKRGNCPPVTLNGNPLPHAENVKYLGMHLDRRLTWKKHILSKRKQLSMKMRGLYWLIGCRSSLTLKNKILLYKSILKPIWTYGIQMWGTACISTINIIERFQAKILRICTGAPWYVPNEVLRQDLVIPTVKNEISSFFKNYSSRLEAHPNHLANELNEAEKLRRLKRFKPNDLKDRFDAIH